MTESIGKLDQGIINALIGLSLLEDLAEAVKELPHLENFPRILEILDALDELREARRRSMCSLVSNYLGAQRIAGGL